MGIKCDKIDLEILFELERNARCSAVELGRRIGKKKDAVRYRIAKLEAAGVILCWKTWIDYYKLGYQATTLVLTILNLPKRRAELLYELRRDPRVYWLGVGEGAWNIAVSFFHITAREFFEIKLDLLSRYRDLICESTLCALVSVGIHEKSFLFKGTSRMLTFTYDVQHHELSPLERKLLLLLYNNPRAEVAELARMTRVSSAIVAHRMAKLKEAGIIIRYSAMIDYHALGYERYKTFIYLHSASKADLVRMLTFVEKSSEIIHIVKQLAPWDFELVIFAKDFASFSKVLDDFTTRFSSLIKKTTTTVLSEDTIYPCDRPLL
jgi:DNA-binding Lrp family transcriptional regulator